MTKQATATEPKTTEPVKDTEIKYWARYKDALIDCYGTDDYPDQRAILARKSGATCEAIDKAVETAVAKIASEGAKAEKQTVREYAQERLAADVRLNGPWAVPRTAGLGLFINDCGPAGMLPIIGGVIGMQERTAEKLPNFWGIYMKGFSA